MEKSKDVVLQVTCPTCNDCIDVSTKFSADPLLLVPPVRGEIYPVEDIVVYKFTSEDLKKFIIKKTHLFVPTAKVEVVPLYCERKRQKRGEPHHSYASLRIAFSTDIVKKNKDMGWYGEIGESSNPRIVKELYNDMIMRYRYDRDKVDAWLKSYKILEELEEGFGMTEAYINEIEKYLTPKRVKVESADKQKTEQWIFFSAMTEKVIYDFLSDPETDMPHGKVKIQEIYPIMKGVVQFVVYVYPHETDNTENPMVRKIMMGEEKPKR